MDMITPYKGIRKGGNLSPYLFILVSLNLSSILNHGKSLNWITGFNSRLTYNFNIWCMPMISFLCLGPLEG